MEAERDVKQVIIVREDLRTASGQKIHRGKMIAQGAHASMAWLTSRLAATEEEYEPWVCPMSFCKHLKHDPDCRRPWHSSSAVFGEAEWRWMTESFTKITLRVISEQELLEIVEKAKEAGLTAELILDEGRTEFGGVPTYTAAAIGPDYSDKIDPVTGHLSLY
jgi:peptidyl-tRNA hydrolase, PTH2 family